MQWDAGEHAGFSTGNPWLPIGADYKERYVEHQRVDSTSLFWFYRTLIALRSRCPALTQGTLHSVRTENGVLIFVRQHQDERFLIALNLTPTVATVRVELGQVEARILLSTRHDRDAVETTGSLDLAGNEGIVIGF